MKQIRLNQTMDHPSRRLVLKQAALVPLSYVIVASLYILFSGRIAHHLAPTPEALARIESFKGIAFVLVTGILLFILCLWSYRRLQLQTMLLVQSERRAMAGITSAGLAHDLNNLLMALGYLLDEIRTKECPNPDIAHIADNLETSVNKLSGFATRLARTAREMQPDTMEEIDLSEQVPMLVKLVAKHPDVRKARLNLQPIPPIRLRLNVSLFEQALLNLIINAAQAAGPEGKIEITAQAHDQNISLTVADNGPGIDPKHLDTIFSTGYTTKDTGSGLGLLCVRAFAESCRGKITLEKSRLGGAAFLLHIPRKPQPHRASGDPLPERKP